MRFIAHCFFVSQEFCLAEREWHTGRRNWNAGKSFFLFSKFACSVYGLMASALKKAYYVFLMKVAPRSLLFVSEVVERT